MKLSKIRTNADAFDGGVWRIVVRDPAGKDHIRMKLRSKLNRDYQDALSVELRELRRKVKDGTLSTVIDEMEARRRASHHLVTDWSGCQDDDGVDLPYSEDACKAIMREPEYTALFEVIDQITGRLASFEEEDAEDLKSESD